MDFIADCKQALARGFGLSAEQLQADCLLLETDAASLSVDFHAPSDSVSLYSTASRPLVEQLESLPLSEQYVALRQTMATNMELFEKSLLRLYLDDGCLGVAADCSSLNCRDAAHFIGALEDVLRLRQQLDGID